VAWTPEEEQRLAQLVAGSAKLGRGTERWAYIASELGNGRTVADVRQRWAERQQSLALAAPAPQPAAVKAPAAAAVRAAPVAASVDGKPPAGWSPEDCRQLGWLVIDAQSKSSGGPRAGADLWEDIASSLVGSRTGRDCRACWMEVLQPEVPGSAFELAVASKVPSTRVVEASGWTDRGHTLYCIETRTAIGRLGVQGAVRTERRFSEFEAFHAAVIVPLLVTQKIAPVEFPTKSVDTWTSKNDPAVVYSRRVALEAYLNAAISLSLRMRSSAVYRAILHFVAAQPGTPPVLPNFDSGHGLWDAAGSWMQNETVSFHGTSCTVPHTLVITTSGQCTLTASGHPAGGKVEAAGIWSSTGGGGSLLLSFYTLNTWDGTSFSDGKEVDELVTSRKQLADKAKPQRASSTRHGQTGWFEVDKGGAVAFRRSCSIADKTEIVARPGDRIRSA
jgi:hypothetical protein